MQKCEAFKCVQWSDTDASQPCASKLSISFYHYIQMMSNSCVMCLLESCNKESWGRVRMLQSMAALY